MKRALTAFVVSLYVAGAACFVIAAWLTHPAVGWVVSGLTLVVLAGMIVERRKKSGTAAAVANPPLTPEGVARDVMNEIARGTGDKRYRVPLKIDH